MGYQIIDSVDLGYFTSKSISVANFPDTCNLSGRAHRIFDDLSEEQKNRKCESSDPI